MIRQRKKISVLSIIILFLLLILVVLGAVIVFRETKTAPVAVIESEEPLVVDEEVSFSSPYYMQNLVMDETTGTGFVNNELIVQYNLDLSEDEANSVARNYRAHLVGFISVTDTAQWRFREAFSEEQLEELIMEIQQDPMVDTAYLNYVEHVVPSDAPTTEGKDWNDDSKRWGYDAIHAEAVFRYKDQMNGDINIGVLDGGFLKSSDLDYSLVSLMQNGDLRETQHGTHVTGICTADTGNSSGIAGVYPDFTKKGGLYAYKLLNFDEKEKTVVGDKSAMQEMDYIARLLMYRCKVINISLGYETGTCYSVQNNLERQGEDGSLVKQYRAISANWEEFLKRWIDHGYEFLICQAAGNESLHSSGMGKPHTLMLDHIDDDQVPIYRQYHDRKGVKKEDVVVTGNYVLDPTFGHQLLAIDDPEVRDRIICVSAYGSDGRIALFSNMGERTDIVAPGVDIWSTIGGEKCDSKSGTSMATPHVTGAAACIWALDDSLTAAEVKAILLQEIDGNNPSRTITDQDNHVTKPLLNLERSMELAVDYLAHRPTQDPEEVDTMPKEYPVSVVVRASDKEMEYAGYKTSDPYKYESECRIDDALISISDKQNTQLYYREKVQIADERDPSDTTSYPVNFLLPAGEYSLMLEAEGYYTLIVSSMEVEEAASDLHPATTIWEFSMDPKEEAVSTPTPAPTATPEPEYPEEDVDPYEEDFLDSLDVIREYGFGAIWNQDTDGIAGTDYSNLTFEIEASSVEDMGNYYTAIAYFNRPQTVPTNTKAGDTFSFTMWDGSKKRLTCTGVDSGTGKMTFALEGVGGGDFYTVPGTLVKGQEVVFQDSHDPFWEEFYEGRLKISKSCKTGVSITRQIHTISKKDLTTEFGYDGNPRFNGLSINDEGIVDQLLIMGD